MSKIKNISLCLFAFVCMCTAASATPADTTATLKNEDPINVKYIGSDGEYLVFEVTIQSDDVKHSSFNITDKSEGELYTAPLKVALKTQTVKIEKRDNQELDFNLKIGNNVYAKSFAVLETVTMQAK